MDRRPASPLPSSSTIFKTDSLAPVCESYFDDEIREVRFTSTSTSPRQDRDA